MRTNSSADYYFRFRQTGISIFWPLRAYLKQNYCNAVTASTAAHPRIAPDNAPTLIMLSVL